MQAIKIQNSQEVQAYTKNLAEFILWGNKTLDNLLIEHLIQFISLLDFKAKNNLIDSILISSESGMPSFLDYSKILSDIAEIGLMRESNFTLDEIRKHLISECDNSHELNSPFLAQTLERVAKRYYLDMLSKVSLPLKMEIKAMLLEQGDASNLVRLQAFGYSLSFSTFMSYGIEVSVKKHRFRFRDKIVFDKKNPAANARVSSSVASTIEDLFGQESNILFYALCNNADLTPRKVVRNVIGPYYNPNCRIEGVMQKVDPYMAILSELLPSGLEGYILGVHRDESTLNLAGTIDREHIAKYPTIVIKHFYIARQEAVQFLQKVLPEKHHTNILVYGS